MPSLVRCGVRCSFWPQSVGKVSVTARLTELEAYLSADLSFPGELTLLLACSRVSQQHADHNAIRQSLGAGIDFTAFAQKAVNHGLAGLAGNTLTNVAPESLHEDILDAFRVLIDGVRQKNERLVAELARVLEELARHGIDAIPIKGPVLTSRAYGDLGLREFRDLDFLIRDRDVRATRAVLRNLGYESDGHLSEAQLNIIHRIQGQEIVFNAAEKICLEPHTRLTPSKMALDIDYQGLWSRARQSEIYGQTFLTLAPEDEFLMLCIHGGKELWWRMNWACDVAAYIQAHPNLDWDSVVERARAQGCLRFLLLATALTRRYFNAGIPERIAKVERDHPEIEPIAKRVAASWLSDEPGGPPSNKTLSKDRLRLHDGFFRRARYALRTWLLPSPHHITWFSLPEPLSFAYVPLSAFHDVFLLPVYNAYQAIHARNAKRENTLTRLTIGRREAARAARKYEEMRERANKMVEAEPTNASAWVQLASALIGLKRYREALVCYDRALALAPDSVKIRKWRNELLKQLPDSAKAQSSLQEPTDSAGWAVRAGDLALSHQYAESIVACDRALALDPNNLSARRLGIQSRLKSCDWRRQEEDQATISASLDAGVGAITPLFHRTVYDSEAEHLRAAQVAACDCPPAPQALWRGERYAHKKIRVAYVSSDMRKHAVANLIIECLEHHDRNRFETTGISLFPDDGSDMRKRMEAAFDRFTLVDSMSDFEVAKLLREHEIDIAVDLNGHTTGKRPHIFAHRPAPIQINFLGYPGTFGARFFDYIIADHVVIPEEHRVYYTEKVAYLPHAYQPNDSQRRIAERTPNRSELGLPNEGFVFTCMNNPSKIRPDIFDVWMRLLGAVEGSVLWLLEDVPSTTLNLRREAKARGIAPDRLIFAPKMAPVDHLARQRAADLFLDTLPYNAHTTASDALWAGLPLLTCMGHTFPGRVAASLLQAVGLPELVTHSLAEYEQLALALARNLQRLSAIKAKLSQNRATAPLFDTALFTRHLETAYATMWQRYEAVREPVSFSVPASADRP